MNNPPQLEMALKEAISTLNNTLGSIYEQQYVYQNGIILNTGFNYGRGEDPFVYRTVWELWAAQYKSRGLCRYNEFAIGATENRVNYVCGEDGYGVEVQARYPEDNTKETLELAKQVTDFLDVFSEVNGIPDMQAESVLRSDEDGEWFIRMFYGKDGMTQLRFIEPEHIRPPVGDNLSPAQSYGIETPENDVLTPIAFHVVEKPYQSSETTRVPGNEVVHGMWNNRSSGKRGYPSFLPVEPNLRRCEALLQSLTQMARTRAKIALVRELTGVDSQTATALMQNLTASRRTRQDSEGNAQNVEAFADGQIVTHGANQKLIFPPPNLGTDDFTAVLQEELKAIATRFQMPLWMFAAVADAKYNNAFIVEAPATRSFTKMQRKQHRLWVTGRSGWRQSIYWRAIVWAVKRRILPESVITLLKLVAKGPTIVSRDKIEEANTNKIYHDMGLKDGITIQHEQSINPDEVASNQLQEFNEGRVKYDKDTLDSIATYLQQIQTVVISEDTGYQLISMLIGMPKKACKKAFPPPPDIVVDPTSTGDPNAIPATDLNAPMPVKEQSKKKLILREQAKYDETLHPRDDHGKFLDKADIESAKNDTGELKRLLAKTTNPQQRKNLLSATGWKLGTDGKLSKTGSTGSTGSTLDVEQLKKWDIAKEADNKPNSELPDNSRPGIDEELKASDMHQYSSEAYKNLNKDLRSTGNSDSSVHQTLQEQFDKVQPFDKPVKVYRGIKVDKDKWQELKDYADEASAEGTTIKMTGYISTSTDSLEDSTFTGNVQYIIKATSGLDMKPYSKYPEENEMLLNHNSEFTVDHVIEVGDTLKILLTQVQPKGK